MHFSTLEKDSDGQRTALLVRVLRRYLGPANDMVGKNCHPASARSFVFVLC